MRDPPSLRQEHHLVHAGVFKGAQSFSNLLRRPDRVLGASLGHRKPVGRVFEVLPQVSLTGLVLPEEGVMPESVNEKGMVFVGDRADFLLVAVAQKRASDCKLRIHFVTDWLTLVLEGPVVVMY